MPCRFRHLLLLMVGLGALAACTSPTPKIPEDAASFSPANLPYQDSRPWTRWWWFAREIKREDIKHQLDWCKANNIGGVEIAWVYPLWRYEGMYKRLYNRNYPRDTTDIPQAWLSQEWTDMAVYAKQYADSIGLGCDFTMGSAWPVAGDNIQHQEGTKIQGWPHFRQTLTFSWQYPKELLVIDHLDSAVFYKFSKPITQALAPALKGSASSFFTDSWEIKLNSVDKIWTTGFDRTFKARFGYDILPYMEQDLDSFPDVRYDYMMHLSDYVIDNFYRPFTNVCHERGAYSRVQCLASPTDVMEAYAHVDIPETESMLNNPNYSRIVSSAAALSGKQVVSSETFTCMYGFPGTYLRQEQTADLKLVADAMFAQGVNHIFYHGMPYNPKGSDSVDFFATVYVGPGGNLTEELPAFNAYMEKVCSIMKLGRTYTDVAAYIPFEDKVMAGALPLEKLRVWVWGQYEMRYLFPPDELEGYHPIWINRYFLERGKVEHGRLMVGEASFAALYMDVQYLDLRALTALLPLAKAGLPVYVKQAPQEPGKVKHTEYEALWKELMALNNVTQDLKKAIPHQPLVKGASEVDFWSRQAGEELYIFFAHPKAKALAYPITCGQAYMEEVVEMDVILHVNGKDIPLPLSFKPYQSLMLKVRKDGKYEWVDIGFQPKDPVVLPAKPQRMCF